MPVWALKLVTSGKVSATPTVPPMAVINMLSPSSSLTTNNGRNPSTLSVAYSPRRSRAVIVMVLAITARMMTMMIRLTACTAMRMASLIETKPSWKAFSVSVSVSASELVNSVSMRCAIRGASSGWLMPTMNTPTWSADAPLGWRARTVSITRCQCTNICCSSVRASAPW